MITFFLFLVNVLFKEDKKNLLKLKSMEKHVAVIISDYGRITLKKSFFFLCYWPLVDQIKSNLNL